jgi:hypothetical protein
MEESMKKATSEITVIPTRDHVIIKGTSDVSVIELAMGKLNKDSSFNKITLVGYGDLCIKKDNDLDIGMEVIIGTQLKPENRVLDDNNNRTFLELSEFYRNLAKDNNEEYIKITKENPKIEVVEYFIISIYDIIGFKQNNKTNEGTKLSGQ